MKPNTFNIDELQDVLADISSQGKGSLEVKNAYVIKQFNYENGMFISWFTSNRNRQMGNIGFVLLQQGLVSSKDLYDAFLQQVQLRKHYCQILIDSQKLSTENLQIAINQTVFEEIAEVFTWQSGNYKIAEKKVQQSSMYGNPYLHTLTFETSTQKISSQIPSYIKRWQSVCEQLQNLNMILYVNPKLQTQLDKYLRENYILYENDFDSSTNKIFLNCIGKRIEKNLSFVDKPSTIGEIIPLLSIDPLWFCDLILDLKKYNYLIRMFPEEIMDLAEKNSNISETKRLYNVLLETRDVQEETKSNIQNVLRNIEETTSQRIVKYNPEAVEEAKDTSIEDQFPGYEIIEELGQGAMGTVYKAKQKSLNRYVAIKVVRPSLVIDEMYIKRLEIEAKTMAQLKHPSIVAAIDFGFHKNLCYIVMEYIAGGTTLLDIIEKEDSISEKEALRVGLSIAGALKYLHENHLIHRDIKPSNILLDENQTAKLADLGLIKDTQASSGITFPGSAVGTPAYMSPEQLQMDSDIDIRSDIYSLGATLFYALTGKSRFDNETPPGVIYHKVVSEGNAFIKKQANLSASAKHVLAKMLDPQKQNRYKNPQELMEDLELAIVGRTVKYAKKTSIFAYAFVLTLILSAITVAFVYPPAKKAQQQDNTPVQQAQTQQQDKQQKLREEKKQPQTQVAQEQKKDFTDKKDIAQQAASTKEEPTDAIELAFRNKQYVEVLDKIAKLDEKHRSLQLRYLQGMSLVGLQKYDAAIAHFREWLSQAPSSSAYFGLAMSYYLSNEPQKALANIKLAQNISSAEFFYLRTRIFFRLNLREKAQKDLNHILQKYPSFWQANYLLSLILLPQPERALESLSIALENGGEMENTKVAAWLYYYKGILQYKLKNFAGARKSFMASQAKWASKDALYYATMLQEKGNYKESIDLYSKSLMANSLEKNLLQVIDTEPLKAFLVATKQIHYQRGKAFLQLKSYKLAVSEFRQATKLDVRYLPALQEIFRIEKQDAFSVSTLDQLIELDSQNSAYYWERAKLHFKIKRYQNAVNDSSVLIQRKYKLQETLRLRAKSYMAMKDRRAIDDINHILKKSPQDLQMLIRKARLQVLFKKNATATYESILHLEPKNQKAYQYLTSQYLQQKNYTRLVEVYKKCLSISPNNFEYLYGLGRCYIELKKYSTSIDYLSKIDESYLKTSYYLGYAYYFSQNTSLALEKLSIAIQQRKIQGLAYYLRGNLYYKKNMYRETIIDFSKYLKYAPRNTNALLLRAQSYEKLNLYKNALRDYTKASSLAKNNYQVFERKATCQVKLNLYKSAIKNFLYAKKYIALQADSYHYLGYCYSQIGQIQQAMTNYQRAIELDSQHVLAHTNYAITLYTAKKYEEALQQISTAVSLDKTNVNALKNRGKIYLKLQQYENAAQDFLQATQIDEDKDVRYYLGLSYYKLQNFAQAEANFREALQGSRKKSLAKKYLQIIKKVKNRK